MYKISVPIMNDNITRCGRENVLRELKRFDTERVILALDTYEMDLEKRKANFKELAENCRFFKEHGYEVGAWTWTFWIKGGEPSYRNMRSIDGAEIKEYMCPTDENFVKFSADYITEIAKCGVDIIQFDDDFRYGFLSSSPACLCDEHIARINKITNSDLTREQLREHIISGGPNIYRDAFLQANGDAFRAFATEIRKAVDKVNPNIRISLCSCLSSWDIDGTNAAELATILAGNTKPLLRLIGAPYWGAKKAWGNLLQDTIELERMESSWSRNDNIEIMAEGDAFPRPRTLCPASYLEIFDTAIRASGCTDGILKYGMDYVSNVDYETGYAVFHERNRDNYAAVCKAFSGKKGSGVRIYETMNKLRDMVMPTKVNATIDIQQDLFFSKAARTLAYNTIPTVYEGDGVCGAAFDENARKLPASALKNGLIIDIAAAEILMERGIDVGIEEICEPTHAETERFIKNDNSITTYGATIYNIKLKNSAEVLSEGKTPLGAIPMSYRYENADGNRFLVLNINTRTRADNVLKHYARSQQYAEQVQWLGGKKLPAYVRNSPQLYIQCKQDDSSLSVGLWNIFADVVVDPVVELGEEYSGIEFINCNGKLEGDKVYLTDIAAYGFAGFQVKK